MKKRVLAALLCVAMTATLLVGCGGETGTSENPSSEVETNSKDTSETPSETDTEDVVVSTELSVEPLVYYPFESTSEGWTVVVEDTAKSSNKAYDASLATGGVNRTIVAGDSSLADLTHPGVNGNCAYLDRTWAVDLEFDATNTDEWTVSFWVWALGMTDYMPTLQFGSDLSFTNGQGNVSWLNVTKTSWVGDVYPMLWSRNEQPNSWPWMYAYDTTLHGYKEWVHVTIVATGETYTAPDGIEAAGAQLYLDGQLVYDSWDNYNNATYFDVTDGLGTMAPYLMQPVEGTTFEAYFGINYWDTMYKGCVDEFYLFDKALSADDVAALYARGDGTIDPEVDLSNEPTENRVLLGQNGPYIGASDFTTAFWKQFTDIWEVPEGQSKTVSFTNYHTNLNFANYMNAVVVLQSTPEGHSVTGTTDGVDPVDGYSEYAVLRLDNYGWLGSLNTNDNLDELGWKLSNDWDFSTVDAFKDVTHGASVEVTVTNNGGTADVVIKLTSADGSKTHTQSYKNITVDGSLYFCFTCEKACLDEIKEVN